MLFGFFITSQNVLRKCNPPHVHVTIPGVRPETESTITSVTVFDYFYTDNSNRFDGNHCLVASFSFLGVIDGSSRAHVVESMSHKECAS